MLSDVGVDPVHYAGTAGEQPSVRPCRNTYIKYYNAVLCVLLPSKGAVKYQPNMLLVTYFNSVLVKQAFD